MTRVTVERIDEKGNKRWATTRLSIDPVAGAIEVEQRGPFGRRRPLLVLRTGEITSFDIVMVSDPLEHLYSSVLLVAMLAGLNVSGWISDSAVWEIGRILLDLAAVGLAFLLASWIKVPAIRLERPFSQSSPPPQANDLDVASLKGRNPKEIVRDPTFRHALAESLVKWIARRPAGTLRNALSTLDKDPAKGLEQLAEISGSSTHDWVHIVSTWSGVAGTRSLATQIADVLALHRYRGMFPDLSDDSRWHAARLRRLLGAGLVMVVSLSVVSMVIPHLVK
jgi:hypothetical protein